LRSCIRASELPSVSDKTSLYERMRYKNLFLSQSRSQFFRTFFYTRVARWFVFKPKIQIWVNYGGSCNGRRWYILWTLGPFFGLGLLLYFMDIWYSSWFVVIWYIFWYFVPRKIWQPCFTLSPFFANSEHRLIGCKKTRRLISKFGQLPNLTC
jgi:hypothetical protein